MISNEARADLRKRLRGRQRVFAGWTSIGHPQITEALVRSGVDFMGIDIEHSTISLEQSQRIIAASQAAGAACLPRIASHNEEDIKRLLDSGADGIIVPMVSNPEEVEALAAWCKYPPLGRRSFGVARAQGYGLDFDDYVASWNDSSMLIIQIESVAGVENIDAMLAFDAVDGVMVGPFDLSGSLGVPGQLDHPKVKTAAQKVIDACARAGRACGTHVVDPNADNMEAVFTDGYTFTALSSDVFLLGQWASKMQGIIGTVRAD
jgi:2-keto-3-deoxy-L-rhamnonate aldolase RhmA